MTTLLEFQTKYNSIFDNIETFKSSIINNSENKTLTELLIQVTNEISTINTYTLNYNTSIALFTDDLIAPTNFNDFLQWLNLRKTYYERVINYENVYPFIKRANNNDFSTIVTRRDIDNELKSIANFNIEYNKENSDIKLIIDSLISSSNIILYKKSLNDSRAESAPYIYARDVEALINRKYKTEQYERIIYNAYERIDAVTEGKITSYVTLLSHTTKDKVKFLRKALVLLSAYYIQHGINFEGRQVSESVNGLSENVANSWPIGYLPKEVVNLLVAAGLVKKATLIDPIGQNCTTPFNVNDQDSEIIEGLSNFELRPITYIEFVRAWNEKVGLADMNRLITEYLKSTNLLDENLEHPTHEIPEISSQQSYIESFGDWEAQYTDEQIEHLQTSTDTFDLTKFDIYKVFDQFIYGSDTYVVTNVSTSQLTVVPLYRNKPVITIVKQGANFNGQLLDYNSSIPSPYNVNNANLNLHYTNSILTWIKDIYDHPISDPTNQGTQLDYNSRFSFLDSNTPMLPVFINGKGNTIIGINATKYLSSIFVKKDEISPSQTDVFKIENHVSHSQVAELIELDKLISVIYDDTDVNSLSNLKVNDLVYYSGEIYITFAKDSTYTYLINKYKRQVWRHTSTLHPDELNGTKGILTVKETALALEYVKKHAPTVDTSGENFFIDLLTSVYNGEDTEHGFVPFYTAGHTIVGFETGAPDTGIALIDPTIKGADNHSTVLHHPLIESLASDDRTSTFLDSLYYFEKDGKMYLKQVNGDVKQLLYSDSGLNTIHSILHNNITFAYKRDTYNKAEIDSKLEGLLRLDDLLLNETTLPWTSVPLDDQRAVLADVFKVPETFYGLNVGKWSSDWAHNPLTLRTEEKVYLYKFNNFGIPQTFIQDIWSLWKKDTVEFPSDWDDLTEDQKHDEALKFVNRRCGSSYKRSDFEHIGGSVTKLDHINPIRRSDLGKLYEYFINSQQPPVYSFESNFSTPQKWSDEYGYTKEQFYNHFVKNTIITRVDNMVKSSSVDVALDSFAGWKQQLTDSQLDDIARNVKNYDSTKYSDYKLFDKIFYDGEVYIFVSKTPDNVDWIIAPLLKNLSPFEIRRNGNKVRIIPYDDTLPSPYNTRGANLNLQYISSILSWIKYVKTHPISHSTPEDIVESYNKRFTFLEGHLPTFPIFTTEDGTIYGVNALGFLNDSFAKLHQIETGETVYATKKDTYTRPQIDTKIDSIFRTTNPLLSELTLGWEKTPSEAQKTALLSTLKIPETYYALEEEGYGGDYATQPLSLNVGDKINIYKIVNFGEKTYAIKDAWSLYKGPGDWDDLTEYQKRATLLAWINDICSSTYVLSNYTKPNGEVEELSHIVHIKRSDLALLFKHFETDNDSDVAEEEGIVKTPKLYSEKNHLQQEDFYNLLRGKIENLTKVSMDSFIDWETQLTDEQIDIIKEDIHAFDWAKFDDYKVLDLFTFGDQVFVCARLLNNENIFAINLLRNQAVRIFNKTAELIAIQGDHVKAIMGPYDTELANLNLKYINSIYSWIEDHDNQAISTPIPGGSVFGDWETRLKYITPEYSNYPTLPVFTNRKGKIFGVKAYSYLKKFFALKTDIKSHTTIESFEDWNAPFTNEQIDLIRGEVSFYDENKLNEYKIYDLFDYNDSLYIVSYKYATQAGIIALNLLRNTAPLKFTVGDIRAVTGNTYVTTIEAPFNENNANLSLNYVNSTYSFLEDGYNHVISNPDQDDNYDTSTWNNRFNYNVPEASNFPTMPVFTNLKGKMFGINGFKYLKNFFATKDTIYTRQQIDAQLNNRLSELETEVTNIELLPYDVNTNPTGLKWEEVPTASQREKLLAVLSEPDHWYGNHSQNNHKTAYIIAYDDYIDKRVPFTKDGIKHDVLDELSTVLKRIYRINDILGTSYDNDVQPIYWRTGDIQKLIDSGRYYKSTSSPNVWASAPKFYSAYNSLSQTEFFNLLREFKALTNLPDEINHKLYAKIADTYNKPQIDAKFNGILRTEDLILNRDTIPWTTVPTTEKLQTLVTVLNTEAEYYSLVQEGYGSNIISQPLSLDINDKVDIYQICNFKEESCVIRDIWQYYRGPTDWNDLTDYQKHFALLTWINNLCGSNYTLSNYIRKDGTTSVLSHIIHVKRSDLGKIYKEFRDVDTTRATNVLNIASTPEKYSLLNHLTEDEFYDLLADKSLSVKAVNNASIESFHGWNEQLRDDQIDFIRAEVPDLDMTKFDTYKVYDLFVQDDELYIIANIVDPSLYCINLLRNYAVIKFSKDGSSDLIGSHGQFVEEPFNTDGANLSIKYVNSVYSFVEDYQNHVISNPDPQDEIAQSWENRFTYLDPSRSNFPSIPVFTNQKGKFFGIDGYDYFKNFFSLIGANYTKHQVDILLENRLAPLETKIVDQEMEPFDEDNNPTGLRWTDRPTGSQKDKLINILKAPVTYSSRLYKIDTSYFFRDSEHLKIYKYLPFEKVETYISGLNYKDTKTILERITHVNSRSQLYASYGYYKPISVSEIETVLANVDLQWSKRTDDYDSTVGENSPKQYSEAHGLTESQFRYLITQYEAKVEGQKLIENIGNDDITDDEFKDLGSTEIFDTARSRLEMLHTPHPWVDVIGTGSTITKMDSSNNIEANTYFAGVGKKTSFPIIDRVGSQLKYFSNSFFVTLNTGNSKEFKDGLYSFDIHIEPPLNTSNVRWHSFLVPKQTGDTTNKTFQYLVTTDNYNATSSTTKTYFHSTLKSASPWQLNANLYNHYFATKTGVNIKGNIKWTKATGDLLYWGDIWWLTNNDVYRHPFYVYYHMRNNVALNDIKWTFNANGNYNLVFPTKFNLSVRRESGH